MKAPKNWIAALGIGLSLPSTIFAVAWGSMKLVEMGYISKFWGVTGFLLIICNSLFLLVWNGINKKNRS